jgi:hypothetical protein
MITFEFNNLTYPIKLTYGVSLNVLPQRFGINLSKIFTDPEMASQTLQNLTFDDEKTLQLMWYFIEPTASMDYDEFLEKITPKELENFREMFWAAVVNFSGSLKKNILLQMWDDFKREVKKADLMKMTSEASSSVSSQEEST